MKGEGGRKKEYNYCDMQNSGKVAFCSSFLSLSQSDSKYVSYIGTWNKRPISRHEGVEMCSVLHIFLLAAFRCSNQNREKHHPSPSYSKQATERWNNFLSRHLHRCTCVRHLPLLDRLEMHDVYSFSLGQLNKTEIIISPLSHNMLRQVELAGL